MFREMLVDMFSKGLDKTGRMKLACNLMAVVDRQIWIGERP